MSYKQDSLNLRQTLYPKKSQNTTLTAVQKGKGDFPYLSDSNKHSWVLTIGQALFQVVHRLSQSTQKLPEVGNITTPISQ